MCKQTDFKLRGVIAAATDVKASPEFKLR